MRSLLVWMLLLEMAAHAQELRVPGAEVASTFERALTGLDVHLDHDVVGLDGKRIERSFVKLPEASGGERRFFSLPERSVDLGALGRAEYRARDINLSRLAVEASDHDYLVTLFFEDQGFELVAVPQKGSGGLASLIPHVQLEKISLQLVLTPRPGTAEVKSAKVRFHAEVKPAGMESLFGGEAAGALDRLTGYQQLLRTAIEAEASRVLAGPEVLGVLNARLREVLAARGKGTGVPRARFEGTDLVLSSEERGSSERKAPKKR
jgi:hypothetical protein